MKNISCCWQAANKCSFFMERLLFPASWKRNEEAEIKLNFDEQLENLVCCSSIFCWCRTKKSNNKKKCSKWNIYRLANLDLLNLTPLLKQKKSGLIEENVRDRDSPRLTEYFDTTFLQWCVWTHTCFLWHSSAHFFLNLYCPKEQIRSEYTTYLQHIKHTVKFPELHFPNLIISYYILSKFLFFGGGNVIYFYRCNTELRKRSNNTL